MALDEKRINLRKSYLAVVDYTYKGRIYREFIKNICFGGVFIETASALPVGEEIVMTFMVAGNKIPIRKKGTVVWSGPRGFGVKFS
jgi:Tfp pilus assembly protein PilZ